MASWRIRLVKCLWFRGKKHSTDCICLTFIRRRQTNQLCSQLDPWPSSVHLLQSGPRVTHRFTLTGTQWEDSTLGADRKTTFPMSLRTVVTSLLPYYSCLCVLFCRQKVFSSCYQLEISVMSVSAHWAHCCKSSLCAGSVAGWLHR